MKISEQKQLLRREMQALLKGKVNFERVQNGVMPSFEQQLLALPAWRDASSILLYASLPGEPNFLSLLEHFSERQFFFPRIEKHQLHLFEWHPGARWITGRYGLQEPDPQDWARISTKDVELALIPGLAFDQAGGRLGRGGGFYDRLLSSPEWRGFKIGVAWPWQIVSTVPREKHDILMDVIMSPEASHHAGSYSSF